MQEHKDYIIIHEIDSTVCINLYEHDSDCAQSQRPNKEGEKTSKKMTPSSSSKLTLQCALSFMCLRTASKSPKARLQYKHLFFMFWLVVGL